MECIKCMMDKSVSGQAFTKFVCEKCGKEDWHHNTAVPRFCSECSRKYNICEKCGENLK